MSSSEKKAADAARKRLQRQQETPEQREARLTKAATARREKLSSETEEERQLRLHAARDADRKRRENQTESQQRLQQQAASNSKHMRLANETDDQRQSRLDAKSEAERNRLENEKEEQRQLRLEAMRVAYRKRRENETEECASQRRQAENARKRMRQSEVNEQRAMTIQELVRSVDENEALITEHDCGNLSHVCTYCQSLNFLKEKPTKGQGFTRCCGKGKVQSTDLHIQKYPEELEKLMKNEHPNSSNFMENVRSINCSFAFASMGASLASPPGSGPYCFRIHGQIYHRTGPLHAEQGKEPQFAQLYILDPEEATNKRMSVAANSNCERDLMARIDELMRRINPFTKAYKMLHEVEKESEIEALENNKQSAEIVMAIKHDRKNDQRRYNSPRENEVAVVFKNVDGEPPFERDLLIYLRPSVDNPDNNRMQRINLLNKNLDPMTYPLLFPYGEQGWGTDIPLHGEGKRSRVSQMQYYGFRTAIREEFNPILNAGKLTQQYFVDSYVKMEANRLNFIKMNQQKLRIDKYKGLMDHINTRAENENLEPGRMVILPSSFEGSPRNMQQRYQDAMAIVTKFGKPDLFITMTCNPKWIEITQNLERWQKVEHRPDLVARVFNLKLEDLLEDVTKNHIFGKVAAHVYVIEFQKRGLPHAHILVILDKDSKLRTENDIDRVVRAEIPDITKNPRLHEIVKSNMIHGPCGTQNPNCVCMENGVCKKGFPKEFQEKTLGNVDGYPKYKRGKEVKIYSNNKLIDNTWVVPYNPYLLLKYNCHINVEICASVKSVKYLFKYVYKGHDCADIEITEQKTLNHDEVQSYVDSRYVSAPEAAWRLNGMHMHKHSHTVFRLAVHLSGEQNILFDPNNLDDAAQRAEQKSTTLMGWFLLNREAEEKEQSGNHSTDPMPGPDPRELFYFEIPNHFTWDSGKWKRRQRGGDKVIGRMYSVHFTDTERYYLRILLLHVKGSTSFEDLRTVNGILCDSFREAAKQRGLLMDDSIWRNTIAEAVIMQMPCQLRQLFAFILVLGNPTEPEKIWNDFKCHFVEDYCFRNHQAEEECTNCEILALQDIQETLRMHGKKCSEYNLPDPPWRVDPQEVYNETVETSKAEAMIASLNAEQTAAFQEILSAIQDTSPRPKCFFLDGPGGSGKTYLYETLLHYLRGLGKSVLPSASTGIAANLLIGGRTYHSTYKLPIPINETSVSKIEPRSDVAQSIRDSSLLIIDECTMASNHAINTIDRLLQEITRLKGVSCGGKVMLLGGDFRQCLTIVPHAMRPAIVQSTLKYSKAWRSFKRLTLKNNMRSVDPLYSEWLLKLGDGALGNDYDLGNDVIEIPEEFICQGSIVEATFGLNISKDMCKSLADRAILCPKNSDVDKLNDEVLSILEGEFHTYTSDDSVESEEERDNFPVEFLNSVTPSGMPPHELKLKEGAIIMLLRNLNTKNGLCNGTRLIVKNLKDNFILAEVLTGRAKGQDVFIPRSDLNPSDTELPFKFTRRQFPVKVAFAMTINKSQGQTLDKVGIYLPEPVFGHGQLYVAFSRVRRSADVKIKILETPTQGKLVKDCGKLFTQNVVYREVFVQ